MSVASTPWASRSTTRTPTRPTIWPLFAALALLLMGVGATLGGIGTTSPASSRAGSSLAVAAAAQHQGQAVAVQLAAVEPGLATLPLERVANAAAATCGDLREGVPDQDMVIRTVARFGGSGYALSDVQATQILAAVRSGYCGTPPVR